MHTVRKKGFTGFSHRPGGGLFSKGASFEYGKSGKKASQTSATKSVSRVKTENNGGKIHSKCRKYISNTTVLFNYIERIYFYVDINPVKKSKIHPKLLLIISKSKNNGWIWNYKESAKIFRKKIKKIRKANPEYQLTKLAQDVFELLERENWRENIQKSVQEVGRVQNDVNDENRASLIPQEFFVVKKDDVKKLGGRSRKRSQTRKPLKKKARKNSAH
jgi:hypothetical protein